MLDNHTSTVRPNYTEADVGMQAGYTSLMNGEDGVGETHDAVLNEQAEYGYSPTTEGTNTALRQEQTETLQQDFPTKYAELEGDTEAQSLAFKDAYQDGAPEKPMIATLHDDINEASPAMTPEDVARKNAISTVINDYADWKQAKQAVLDGDAFDSNASLASKATDFLALMVPFYEQSIVADAVVKSQGGDFSDVGKAFALMGQSKASLVNAFQKMSISERTKAVEGLASVLHDANTVGFMTNDMNGQLMLNSIINGDYSDVEQAIDNVVSIMDLSIIGKPVAAAVGYGRNVVRVARMEKAASTVKPTSPVRVANDVDPKTSREMFAKIADDQTDNASNALAGTTRTDAIADSVLPEPTNVEKSVRNKTPDIDMELDKAYIMNGTVRQVMNDARISALTKQEIKSANANVVNRMKEAIGVSARKEMFQVEATEGGANIRAVYGAGERGWDNAEEAKDLVEISLRDQGIKREELSILKKDKTGDFVPFEGKDLEDGAEYLVAVDYKYDVSFNDITEWSKFKVRNNFFDRIPVLAKNAFSRHILDPASMLDKHITLGANVAVDRSALTTQAMVAKGAEFTKGFSKAPKEQRVKMWNYIEEANDKGIKFNAGRLKAEYGLDDDSIFLVGKHRQYWDDVYAVRNRAEIEHLRGKGFKLIEDSANDTRLFGIPKAKQSIDLRNKVYDPDTNTMKAVSTDELNKLYEQGGGVMQMRTPMQIGDDATPLVMYSKDKTPRGLRNSDTVYSYRDGYYQRSYKAPHFIVEVGTLADGTKYKKARATAQNKKDAELYKNRMIKDGVLSGARKEYEVFHDVKDMEATVGFDMDIFDTYGQSTQRTRGKQLEDATAILNGGKSNHLADPIETIIDSAESMGRRAAMSDYLEATKQRFMDTYAPYLKKENGKVVFPDKIEEIGTGKTAMRRDVADARTTFEYIAYLEHGYINMLDAGTKGMLRAIAEIAGDKGLVRTEKLARKVAEGDPTQVAKATAFNLYLALNPLRQGVLNAHQATLLAGNFPKYVGTKLVPDTAVMTAMMQNGGLVPEVLIKATGKSASEWRVMYDEYLKTGLPASVTSNNLVRASMKNMADVQMGNRAVGVIGKGMKGVRTGLDVSRKVGFDLGEHFNLMTAWLAHYDKAKSAKAGLNKSDFANIGGETRNYTFNMSRAGDMAYNQNSLALFFQFFQVPHKALLNATTNRVMTKRQKSMLFLHSAAGFTLPATAMYRYFGDVLPNREENPELHDAVVQGLQFYAYNKALNLVSKGGVSGVDFSSLSPADAYGIYEMLHGILTTDMGAMIASTPSGQLFFSDNARIKQLVTTTARFFNATEDFEGTPTEASHVYKRIGELSSGWSNLMRAKYAMEYGKLVSRSGAVLDPSVTSAEAMALAFGFRTLDEARSVAANDISWGKQDKLNKEVKKFYNSYVDQLKGAGEDLQELDHVVKVMSEATRVFDGPTQEMAMRQINVLLSKDARRGEGVIYQSALRMANYMTPSEFKAYVNNLPDGNEQLKKDLLSIADDMDTLEGME